MIINASSQREQNANKELQEGPAHFPLCLLQQNRFLFSKLSCRGKQRFCGLQTRCLLSFLFCLSLQSANAQAFLLFSFGLFQPFIAPLRQPIDFGELICA